MCFCFLVYCFEIFVILSSYIRTLGGSESAYRKASELRHEPGEENVAVMATEKGGADVVPCVCVH